MLAAGWSMPQRAVLFAVLPAVAAAGSPPSPPDISPLALSCQGCHQTSVNSPEMPALNRLPAAQIAGALRQARDQPRPGTIMPRFTAHLSDAEIDALARELGRPAR
jgi:cytochrome c553